MIEDGRIKIDGPLEMLVEFQVANAAIPVKGETINLIDIFVRSRQLNGQERTTQLRIPPELLERLVMDLQQAFLRTLPVPTRH